MVVDCVTGHETFVEKVRMRRKENTQIVSEVDRPLAATEFGYDYTGKGGN